MTSRERLLLFCAGAIAGVAALELVRSIFGGLRRRAAARRGALPWQVNPSLVGRGEEEGAGPVCVADFEALALAKITSKGAWDYFRAGAGEEVTQARNEMVLCRRLALRPRVLVNVSRVSSAHLLLGKPTAQPWGIAPTAFHGIAHEGAECATARAAARAGIVYCQSSSSSMTMEEVTEAVGRGVGRRLCQMYYQVSREWNLAFLRRAEAAGMEALVLTVDRPVLGLRYSNTRNNFQLPGRKDGDPNVCACEFWAALQRAFAARPFLLFRRRAPRQCTSVQQDLPSTPPLVWLTTYIHTHAHTPRRTRARTSYPRTCSKPGKTTTVELAMPCAGRTWRGCAPAPPCPLS